MPRCGSRPVCFAGEADRRVKTVPTLFRRQQPERPMGSNGRKNHQDESQGGFFMFRCGDEPVREPPAQPYTNHIIIFEVAFWDLSTFHLASFPGMM